VEEEERNSLVELFWVSSSVTCVLHSRHVVVVVVVFVLEERFESFDGGRRLTPRLIHAFVSLLVKWEALYHMRKAEIKCYEKVHREACL
jgi:hypothetical protein